MPVYDSAVSFDLRRRDSFDEVAKLYEEARPGYPMQLYEDVVALSGIREGGRILEVGCGPGTATVEFARRGYSMVCLELGARLAARARKNCSVFPRVDVQNVAFEDWALNSETFDLVVSASAFHWIEPKIKFVKTATALRPGGSIALFWNRDRGFEKPLREALNQIYREEAPEFAKDHGDELERLICRPREEIDASGLFGEVTVRRYSWSQPYTAEGYGNLLQTYSDHIALSPHVRERLTRRIEQVIRETGGTIIRHYVSLLYVARRR